MKKEKLKYLPKTKYSNIQYPTSNTAITLIALIIVIIVLLILSGITLISVLGENGIIAKAQTAKEKTIQSQEREEKSLQDLNYTLEEYYIGSRNSNSQKELLYSNEEGWGLSSSDDLILSKPWTEFTTLMFIGCFMSEREYGQVEYVPLELLNYNMKNNKKFYFSQDDIHYFTFKIKDEKTFSFTGSRANTQCVYYVYGIK